MSARRAAALGLVISLGAVAAVGAWWLSDREQGDVGVAPIEGAAVQAGLPMLPAPGRSPTPDRPGTEGAHTEEVPVKVRAAPARLADIAPGRRRAPVELRIPALGIRAPIVAVGVDPDSGEMELPPDRSTIAWYRHGAVPGTAGSAVLAGHVDYGAGRAVFFSLATLRPGALVVIRFRDGTAERFRVVGRRQYEKQRLPARLFSTSGRPVLSLITCGGGYSAAARSYDSNVVVFAVPDPGQGASTPAERPVRPEPGMPA